MKCPICQVEAHYLYTINRFRQPFSIFQCKKCKLQMKGESLTDIQKLKNYYSKNYYEGTSEYSYIDERKYEKYFQYVWNARLKTIKKYKPPPARFLDVGCSFGGFVKSAQFFGYEVEGIDISEYTVSSSQRDPYLKNKIFLSDLLSFQPEKKYDIITLIEVIEHLPEPQMVFKKLYELLNSQGMLVIQTANFDGLQAKLQKSRYHYYLPGHLFYYSKSNLTHFLRLNGFSKFKYFHGVEFGLLPKIKKMRGFFQKKSDYLKIIRVFFYHYSSKIAFHNFSLTSSFVMYAFKD